MMEVCERPINEAVHQTLKKGFKEDVLNILQQKINPNCISDNGDTVLHSILRNDKLTETNVVEILTIFLTQKVNPNIENNQEQTVLQLAVERRMKNAVNCLLQFQADIRVVNKQGNSIAHFFIEDEYEKCKLSMRYPIMNTPANRDAMEHHSVTFLEFLVSIGVDFDFKNGEGQSALHLACEYYLPHILPTLLAYSNDITSVNKDKKMILELFLEGSVLTKGSHLPDEQQYPDYNSKYTAKVLKALLDRVTYAAGNVHVCNLITKAIRDKSEIRIIETLISYYLTKCGDRDLATNLFTELSSTCSFWSSSEVDYFLTVLSDLLAHGVIVSDEPTWHKLVTLAMEAKNLPLLEFLKGNGASFSFKSQLGQNLLHVLAEQRYEDSDSEFYSNLCDLLVCGDCEINATDIQGKIPLHSAARNGHVLMVRKLIELGAEINPRDRKLCTPLHDAALNGSVEIVELLLASGADVNVADSNGEMPLNFAITKNNVAVVRLLIENGAAIDGKNKNQQTLLHRAATINQAVQIVELLLTCGVDVDAADSKGDTPLHLAVINNNADVVQSLIENGASVNYENNHQQTPLHRAATNNKAVKIVQMLLTNGAKVNAKDHEGNGPLHLSVSDESLSMIDNIHNAYKAFKTSNKIPIITKLLGHGADSNMRNNQGQSVLFNALSLRNHVLVDELLKYGANLNDLKVRRPILESRDHLPIIHCLSEYWMKLTAADLPVPEEYKSYVKHDKVQEYLDECSKEVEKLKTKFIDGRVSLYDFLHMRPERRCAYVNEKSLQQLIVSPLFDSLLPKYSVIILASYREATVFEVREKVMAVLNEIFSELRDISVLNVTKKIVDYLQFKDLCVTFPF